MLRFRVVLTVQCKLSKSKLELSEEVFDRAGMKPFVMKLTTRSSGYTSASSRAHPPQVGAALKSRSTGFPAAFACRNASSTSRSHLISAMAHLLRSTPATDIVSAGGQGQL